MKKAQSTLEFTFAVIVIVFLIYGMVKMFRWAGMDLADRRWVQDNSMTVDLTKVPNGDPSAQLNSDVGSSFLPMSAVWHGNITGNTAQ